MKNRKLAWWQIFMLVPIMVALVVLEGVDPLPGVSGGTADAGIVVLFFIAMLGWVHLNGGLLERYYMEQDGDYDLKITVYGPAPKTEADGNDLHDLTPLAIAGSGLDLRSGLNIGLEEKEKWPRN